MPYRVKHIPGAKRPYQIVDMNGKVVGTSLNKGKAQRSIDHRMSAESKDISKYKRKVDNKMKSFGETDLEKKTIRINKSKKKNTPGDVLDTIVHEKEHILHPKKHENTVRRATEKKIKRMSPKQKQKHYSLFKA